MKLFEVSNRVLIRNSIGRTITAKGMAGALNKLYGTEFSIEDTTPYVRAFNQALQSATDEESAERVWNRLYQELSHANKRPPPID